jgi:hypothetical protein
MASTVKVPIIGQVSKGKAAGAMIGGLGVTAYLIYRYEKKAKATAAVAAKPASSASGYGYGTGYGYGESSVEPAGYYGYGNYYGYGASGGFEATGYYGYGVPSPQGVAATTNAQWEQAAITQLTDEGYNAQTVSAALGNYTEGQPVTSAQETIINSAIGIEGYPPDPGANGYPPSINVTGGGGSGQTGTGYGYGTGYGVNPGGPGIGTTGAGGTVAVPSVVGKRGAKAVAAIHAAGLVSSQSPTPKKGQWSLVKSQSPKAGTQVASGSTVSQVLTIHGKAKA